MEQSTIIWRTGGIMKIWNYKVFFYLGKLSKSGSSYDMYESSRPPPPLHHPSSIEILSKYSRRKIIRFRFE